VRQGALLASPGADKVIDPDEADAIRAWLRG
jgi:hypothetical protein